MDFNNFKNAFDFKNNSYFYHITSEDLGDTIIEEGLLVDGTNILDVNNIIFTTAIPITPDMIDNIEDILDEELHEDDFRGTSIMIILGCDKDSVDNIVNTDGYEKDGKHFEGIVYPNSVMGYFNLEHEFIPNDNFDYGSNEFYDLCENSYKKEY
jgi:hypothetical protein